MPGLTRETLVRTSTLRIVAFSAALAAAGAFVPDLAEAQSRGRTRTGTARPRVSRPIQARPIVVRSYRPYFYGYRYPRFYSSFAFGWYHPFSYGLYGWSPFWGYPYYPYYPGYGYYGYYPYYQAIYAHLGEARLQVKPRETEVYVDGYYAGIVDDFDGWSQRLRLEPGDHEIELYLDGHRSFRQTVLLTRGTTLKLRHTMEKLAPGDPPAVRPTPPPDPPPPPQQSARPPRPGYPGRRLPPPPDGPRPPVPAERDRDAAASFGTLAVRVQPADAVIVIDGERWDRASGGPRLVLDLPAGRHRVEVHKEGFQSYVREIEIRPGETATVNVSLVSSGAI